jgi:hypothetical protein
MKKVETVKKITWRPFEAARAYVQNLGLKNFREWQAWSKSGLRPKDIPSGPWYSYKEKGWVSIGDWLGTGRIACSRRIYLPFEKARDFVRKLGLNYFEEWQEWARSTKRPADIPITPHRVYRNKGWKGYRDWLGSSNIIKRKVFRPFEEAREYVQNLGLKNNYEWETWVKSPERPEDIPSTPNKIYKDKGWAGPGDWLGIERIYRYKNKKCSFEEAREYARSLGLRSYSEWKKWSKSGLRPKDIPAGPWSFYKGKGWVNMSDWLGISRIAYINRVYLPFIEARKFARNLGLNSIREWQEWARSTKRPDDIPISPHSVYRNKGWIGYSDWLGNGRIGSSKRIGLSRTFG